MSVADHQALTAALAALEQARDEQAVHRREQAAFRAKVVANLTELREAISRLRRVVEIMVQGQPSDAVEERPWSGPLH
jgi:hypothetical protein